MRRQPRGAGDAQAMDGLRHAARLVDQYAPTAFTQDVKEIRRRLGWILAGFASSRVCIRCQRPFDVDAVMASQYAVKRQPLPQTCEDCRRWHERSDRS
jgi:hypothetical protein